MVFARRLWASRITQKAGFPIRSQEARLLINLLMRASKKNPKELPTAEQVLFAALRMFHDKTLLLKWQKNLEVSSSAERTLAKLPKAAIDLASEK